MKKHFRIRGIIVVCGSLSLLLFSGAADAESVSLVPSKDNTIFESTTATQNSNALGDLYVGRTGTMQGGNIRRALVRFDIAGNVPAGATIDSVTLTITEITGNNGNRGATLNRLLQDWGEGTSGGPLVGGAGVAATTTDATWLYNFYDASTPSSWTTPGGTFVATPSGSATIAGFVPPPNSQITTFSSASNPQMLTDVIGWFNGSLNNFGWIIRGDESVIQTGKRVTSRETATPPTLFVTYTIPEPDSVIHASIAAACGLLALCYRRRYRTADRLAREV